MRVNPDPKVVEKSGISAQQSEEVDNFAQIVSAYNAKRAALNKRLSVAFRSRKPDGTFFYSRFWVLRKMIKELVQIYLSPAPFSNVHNPFYRLSHYANLAVFYCKIKASNISGDNC